MKKTMAIIGHIDMDAFFAAVEERDFPEFRGRPIVVGADPKQGRGRGVVSTANYAARKYGIGSALPITRAWRFSQKAVSEGKPAAIFCSGRYDVYKKVSRNIMKIIQSHVSTIEQMGFDEAYLDLRFTRDYDHAVLICKSLQKDIFEKERLTCSFGIGKNKMIAKIASDFKKPNGFTVVYPKDVLRFIAPLPIRAIPGIGPKTAERLHSKGIFTVQDLRSFSEHEFENMLGNWGKSLYKKSRGIASISFSGEWIPKSIGEQRTFFKDTLDTKFLFGIVHRLSSDVMRRFRKYNFVSFRTVVITVRFADFETRTKSFTIPESRESLEALLFVAQKLLLPFLDDRKNPKWKRIRMLGVRVEKLL